ncbi:effector-associated domain EAD1-containing protein [Tolypothrix sp. VBCCA 56010]|uniref:VMAP-C domain-containing protein n=1 Tax=Tolypothrix sp. VBCCA 56010 TaxID=3137731 RepID=UPI003D7EC9D2
MNPGNSLSSLLDGSLLKEIEAALRDAFPEKTKLEMMLLYEFQINLDDIALGDNYTEIVFKVVKYFKSKDSLAKLINKASEENDGNLQLQSVAKKINAITSLIQILVPLEKDFINQMKQVYLACSSDSLRKDWEDESPDTLKEILANLKDTPQGKAPENPLIQFVARLSEDAEIPELAAISLNKWGKQNANNFSELLTQIRNAEITRNEQAIVQTYLIVLLNPSKQHQNKRYFVSAWFIPNGGNDKFNCQTGEGYKILEIEQQEQETFSLEEIPCLIEDFLDQITPHLTDFSSLPAIEIFLPYELLSEPIDTWIIQQEELPISIGSLYKVIVRSSRRLRKDYPYRNIWVQKWKTLKNLTENAYSKCCTSSECHSWQELFSRLNQDGTIALKLMKPPSNDFLKVMNQTAIPVALWIRQELQNLNFLVELDQLLQCLITELPERVKQKRLDDFPDKSKQSIGHHLSLLWENPYILPPQIEYTTPS